MGEKDTQDVRRGRNVSQESLPGVIGRGKDERQRQGTGGGAGEKGIQGVGVGEVPALVEGQGG